MSSLSSDSEGIREAVRSAKRTYLKEEILDMGYDGDLFLYYCSIVGEADIDY